VLRGFVEARFTNCAASLLLSFADSTAQQVADWAQEEAGLDQEDAQVLLKNKLDGAAVLEMAAGPSSSLPFSLPPYFSLSSLFLYPSLSPPPFPPLPPFLSLSYPSRKTVFVAARAPRAPLSLPSSRVGGAMCGVLRWCVVRGAALWARRNSGATTDPEKPARKQV
jgi:hypothetical protein